jgi:hypothetical protein
VTFAACAKEGMMEVVTDMQQEAICIIVNILTVVLEVGYCVKENQQKPLDMTQPVKMGVSMQLVL